MSNVECFWMEPAGRVRRWLRRYVSGSQCPASGIHQAWVLIEDGPHIRTPQGYTSTEPRTWPHDDPRWPAQCQCGYIFQDDDAWQLFFSEVFRTPATGAETSLREAPPGAMWDAWWMRGDGYGAEWTGPDGLSLTVRLPDGSDWLIDGPANDGGHWTRTGAPPKITAMPSILSHGYHGWLRDGVLSNA